MALNDILSGCIAGINRNCRGVEHSTSLRYTVRSRDFCSFLFRRGWISGFRIQSNSMYDKVIEVDYKFYKNRHAFHRIQLISTPGNRLYYSYKKLRHVCYGNRRALNYVLSTSRGFLSSTEALSLQIGGEVIARIIE